MALLSPRKNSFGIPAPRRMGRRRSKPKIVVHPQPPSAELEWLTVSSTTGPEASAHPSPSSSSASLRPPLGRTSSTASSTSTVGSITSAKTNSPFALQAIPAFGSRSPSSSSPVSPSSNPPTSPFSLPVIPPFKRTGSNSSTNTLSTSPLPPSSTPLPPQPPKPRSPAPPSPKPSSPLTTADALAAAKSRLATAEALIASAQQQATAARLEVAYLAGELEKEVLQRHLEVRRGAAVVGEKPGEKKVGVRLKVEQEPLRGRWEREEAERERVRREKVREGERVTW